MHRVDRQTLEAMIVVTLKRAPKDARRGLSAKLPIETDKAADTLARLIADQLDNTSRMVIEAEDRPGAYRLREWGIDEPYPVSCSPLPIREQSRLA